MTDKEIIKALECRMPFDKVCVEAYDLINRQKAEIERLEYTLFGVMHSVDKWLNDDELEQDEVNRAATMREKTLQIVERKQAEIERLHNILLSFTNEVHTWSNKKGYDTTELSLIPILNESESVREAVKFEAVKEFADRLCEGRVSNDPVVIAVKVELSELTERKEDEGK